MNLKLLTAAAVLSTAIAAPAFAQQDVSRAQVVRHHESARVIEHRDSGFWPADVAAGVVGGAVGTAGAVASAPFRGTRNDNSYAYMDDNASYCAQRYRSYDPASGTYLGRDGRRHVCQ